MKKRPSTPGKMLFVLLGVFVVYYFTNWKTLSLLWEAG